jgi:hypothetical protein
MGAVRQGGPFFARPAGFLWQSKLTPSRLYGYFPVSVSRLLFFLFLTKPAAFYLFIFTSNGYCFSLLVIGQHNTKFTFSLYSLGEITNAGRFPFCSFIAFIISDKLFFLWVL